MKGKFKTKVTYINQGKVVIKEFDGALDISVLGESEDPIACIMRGRKILLGMRLSAFISLALVEQRPQLNLIA